MKNTIITCLLLAFTAIIYGQSTYFEVQETAAFKDIKGSTNLLSVHQLGNKQGTVAVRSIKKDLVISTFDENHKLLENIEFKKEKKESFIGSIAASGIVRVFTSHKVDKKNIDIYSWTYDVKTKKLSKSKLYSQATGKRKGSSFFNWFEPVTRKYDENFRVSPDGKYLAFSVDNVHGKARTSAIRVYDEHLKELFNKVYIEEAEQAYNFDDFIITNNAEVITAGKIYKKGRSDKKKGKANYGYAIYKVTAKESSTKTIDLGDNFIQELRFAQDEKSIRLMGFYSEKNSQRMKGGISFVFDGVNIQNIKPVTTKFPEDIYNDIYSEGKAERLKKKEKELKSYYLDYSLVDEAGNGYLTAEQFYITQHYVSTGNGGYWTTTYHYDNILTIKFDRNGTLVWGRSILKKSNSPSYMALVEDEQLHIFLNTGKNITEKSNGRKKLKKSWLEKSALFDIVFDGSGEQTYELIKENNGRKDFFSPNRGNWDYKTFIMPNFSKNKKQFLVLTKM